MQQNDAAGARELDDMATELKRLNSECHQLRRDWERSAERLAQAERDRGELVELRARVNRLQSLEFELIELRERERTLEAQLYSIGQYPSTRPAPIPLAPAATGTYAAELEDSLRQLLKDQELRSVAVSDGQGLLVACVGDSMTQEGLTAFSALSSELASKLRRHLPLASVELVRASDSNHVTVACRLFEAGGEEYGLSLIGAGTIDPARISGVADAVAKMLAAGRASISGDPASEDAAS